MATIETCLQSARPPGGAAADISALPTPAITQTPASVREPCRILVADDDENIRLILQQAFEAHGYDVDVATTGVEAIRLISQHAYQIAVMDYQMPELDGLAAAKIIYDQTTRKDRPRLIGLTSDPDSLIARDAEWQLVFDDILSKSLGLGLILSTIDRCRDYRKLRSEHPIDVADLHMMERV
jgi:two-component system sensor histidine kinase RpfC